MPVGLHTTISEQSPFVIFYRPTSWPKFRRHFKVRVREAFSIQYKRCLLNNRPLIIGGWSEWSEWDCELAESCGYGTGRRVRSCTNPPPSNGGLDCVGKESEMRICHQPCTTAAENNQG